MEDYGLQIEVRNEELASQRQFARSGVISLIVHAIVATLLLLSPKLFPDKAIDLTASGSKKAHTVMYLTEAPIQPRPEVKPPQLSKKDLQELRAELKLPSPAPPTPEPPAPTPAPPTPAPAPPKALPQTPQAPQQPSQGNPNGLLPPSTTPPSATGTGEIKLGEVKPPEAPKLPVAPGSAAGQGLEGTMRDIARQRAAGGGGGEIVFAPQGRGASSGPGQIGGAQILSDTEGVDFNPYLQRLVFVVRQNWYAVMPEIARMGKRGRVTMRFEVKKNGQLGTLWMTASSASDPLDRAAMAAISASAPFPPLPPEFKGPVVQLQLGFLYNIPLQ